MSETSFPHDDNLTQIKISKRRQIKKERKERTKLLKIHIEIKKLLKKQKKKKKEIMEKLKVKNLKSR